MEKIDNLELLKENAKMASQNSYAPYSQFPVGVSVEDISGNIFTGCNVENLAYPSGICAERTAIFKAVSEVGPTMKIKTLIVYTPTKRVTTPCGSCRQVINEFAHSKTRIFCFCDSDAILDMQFNDLLPESPVIDDL